MKKIPLTHGQYTLVDDRDFGELSKYKWHLTAKGYAARNSKGEPRKTIYMHRQILEEPVNLEIDHKNQNRLDNQRLNLRVCTRAQNSQNSSSKGGKSGYKGVYWFEPTRQWQARIYADKKLKFLGYFTDKCCAAEAYNNAAVEHYGEFARLNIIN